MLIPFNTPWHVLSGVAVGHDTQNKTKLAIPVLFIVSDSCVGVSIVVQVCTACCEGNICNIPLPWNETEAIFSYTSPLSGSAGLSRSYALTFCPPLLAFLLSNVAWMKERCVESYWMWRSAAGVTGPWIEGFSGWFMRNKIKKDVFVCLKFGTRETGQALELEKDFKSIEHLAMHRGSHS